ncbi:hypothetical protein GLOIN_2v1885572 [Rhizophagus irregularis DAOM 181602=DAOM 197198]|nr:hypothetical protein GLOIN_2v1885572 [Rhizophagus irregularis DAOM 181602=DAOM 197198]
MDEEKVSTAQLTDRRMTTEPPPPPLVDEVADTIRLIDSRKTGKTEASTTDGTKEGKKRVIEGIDEVVKVIKKETAKTKHKIKKNKNGTCQKGFFLIHCNTMISSDANF